MPKIALPTIELCDAAYVRAHGHRAAGRGRWHLQRTNDRTCFDADLHGDVKVFDGTMPEVRAAALMAGMFGLVAVLP